jgi:hypothetical protein
MRCTTRLACAAWLVVAVACFEDGPIVQDTSSSSTGGTDPSGATTAGPGPITTTDDHSGTADGSGSTTQGDPTVGDSTSVPPLTDGTGTTDDSGTTTGTTTGSTDGSTGGSTTSGSTTEACDPITEDPSGIGVDCLSDLECLPGYTCQPFEGFVFQMTCQILCEQDCDCPMGYVCFEVADKSGSVWHQCG